MKILLKDLVNSIEDFNYYNNTLYGWRGNTFTIIAQLRDKRYILTEWYEDRISNYAFKPIESLGFLDYGIDTSKRFKSNKLYNYLKDLLEQPDISISLYNNLEDIFSKSKGIKVVLEK